MALTKISRGLLSTGISDSSDATAITIDSSENVLVGSGTSNGISGSTTGLQVAGAGFAGMISATRHDNNAYASALMLGKSRNTTVGSNTIVQSGDEIGAIGFFADDGTNLDSQVAYIRALVDGTPGENDTPGRLTFSTTADGSAAATEKMRLDSSGNLGIGTTSPSSKLHVYGGAILVDNGSSAGTIYFHDTTNYINLSSDALQFANNGAERMRIDSSGEVHVNKTASINSGQFEVLAQADHQAIVAKVQTNVNSMFQGFNASGSAVFVATGAGNLTITGTLYQGSDITLKENIKPLNNQLEIVKKLNPVTFDWKEDKKPYQQIGFIAQEVEKHLPELIEDKDDIKRMSYGNMTTVLVKAIQEQQTQIEALQSEINTLKGGD
jgi:chaperonin cofactor prefoldin